MKNASVIKRIAIIDAAAVGSDPDVTRFIEKATSALGKKAGGFLR